MSEYSRPRKRRKGPPVVSHLPPNSIEYQQQQQQAIAPPGVMTSARPDEGRVICVFGPPGAGTSTIVRSLAAASHLRIAVISPDFEDIAEQVRKQAADVVIIDGFPHCGLDLDAKTPAGPRAIQYLYDNRLVYPATGAIIRVATDPELIVHQRRASAGGIRRFFDGLPAVEEAIQRFNMPYYMIHNEPGEQGLGQAVGDLARRASVNR